MRLDNCGERSVSDGTITNVTVVDADGWVLRPSASLAGHLVVEPGVARKRIFSSVISEDLPAAEKMFNDVVRGRRSRSAATLRYLRADGEIRTGDYQLVDHRNDEHVGGLLLVTRDVSGEFERVEALAQLRAAERFLGENARRIATAPVEELDSALDEVIEGVGRMLGARLITLSSTEAGSDDFALAHCWWDEGVREPTTAMAMTGIGRDLSRWLPFTTPQWVDLDRLRRRAPDLVERLNDLGDRILLYGANLPDGSLGILGIWNPRHDFAAEFVITGLVDLWSIVVAREHNRAQRHLAETRLETLLAHSSDLLVVHDHEYRLMYVSSGSAVALNIKPEEGVGRSLWDFVHPDDMLPTSVLDSLQPGVAVAGRPVRVRTREGAYRTFAFTVTDLRHDETVGGVLINAHDITDVASYKKNIERSRAIEQLVRKVSTTFATSPVDMTDTLLLSCLKELVDFTTATRAGIFIAQQDGDTLIETYQVAAAHVTVAGEDVRPMSKAHIEEVCPNLAAGSVVAQRPDTGDRRLIDAIEIEELEPLQGLLAVPLRSGEDLLGIMLLSSIERGWEFSEQYLGLMRTIGEIAAGAVMRQRVERSLAEGALRDSLTGLGNRRFLVERIGHALENQVRDTSVALMFVDCDGFKAVNDAHGHEHGDQLLIEMARRLERACPPTASIARFGGDEFLVMLESMESDGQVASCAAHVVEALMEPYEVLGRTLRVTVSIGVAIQSGYADPVDASTLLRRADLAMYQAKQTGGNRFQLFDLEMEQSTRARFSLLSELREALRSPDQIEVWYQPLYDLRSGPTGPGAIPAGGLRDPTGTFALAGFEALVRWRHPIRGLVPPGGFIDIAEESGLIEDLGWQVFEKAVDQLLLWRRGNPAACNLTMAVNLSVRQLQSTTFMDRLRSTLVNFDLPRWLVEFEVTEGIFANRHHVRDQLLALRELGLKIAIDDFGTGYSSLAYLRDLPVDTLKIDRSFVSRLGADSRENAMVATVTHLAEQMSIETVAEGVETMEQLQIVKDLGCSYVQGYLLGRPVPGSEIRFSSNTLVVQSR